MRFFRSSKTEYRELLVRKENENGIPVVAARCQGGTREVLGIRGLKERREGYCTLEVRVRRFNMSRVANQFDLSFFRIRQKDRIGVQGRKQSEKRTSGLASNGGRLVLTLFCLGGRENWPAGRSGRSVLLVFGVANVGGETRARR